MLTVRELKELELRTLNAISTQGEFGQLYQLLEAVKRAAGTLKTSRGFDVSLSFTLPTRLREDSGTGAIERHFHIGGVVLSKGENTPITSLSYSVLIARGGDASSGIARKFHFDVEAASARNQAEPKPTHHFQICGKLSQQHLQEGYTEEQLEPLLPAMSKPRVPVPPMSLALILNWLFLEFGSEHSVVQALRNTFWQSIVREAERKVLKPYFEEAAQFFRSATNDSKSFISNHLYEIR